MDICKNCLNYLTAYKNSILKQLWFGHKDNYQDRIDVLTAFNQFIKRGFCCESCEGHYNTHILKQDEYAEGGK